MLNLAKSSGQEDGLREELAGVSALLAREQEFEAFLSNPTVDSEARQRMIEKLLRGRYSDVLVDSLQVLNRKERLGSIRSIAEAYRLLHQEMKGRVEVHVRTAAPLNEALRAKLRTKLAKKTGKQSAVRIRSATPGTWVSSASQPATVTSRAEAMTAMPAPWTCSACALAFARNRLAHPDGSARRSVTPATNRGPAHPWSR